MELTRAVAKTITVQVTDFGLKEDKMPRQWGETVQAEDDRSPPLPLMKEKRRSLKKESFKTSLVHSKFVTNFINLLKESNTTSKVDFLLQKEFLL